MQDDAYKTTEQLREEINRNNLNMARANWGAGGLILGLILGWIIRAILS